MFILQEIQLTSEEKKPQQISIELAVLMHSKSEFIVKFYGSFFQETRVYYGMEYMDGGSLDRLYADGTPEPIIARISYSVYLSTAGSNSHTFLPLGKKFRWSRVSST